MPREEDDVVADQEERMINEEYKIWKKNTPFLYGMRCPRNRFCSANCERCDMLRQVAAVLQIL
jgi:hypothetical protein